MPPTLESVSKKRKLDEVFQGHNVPPYRENATQYAPDHLLLHHSETVDGFIKTRRHNRKVVDAVVKFVEDVKGALSTMESLGFPSLHDAERELQGRGVSVPFDSALGDVSESQKVTFHPPNQIEIGGGLSHRFLPKFQNHTPVADLIIGISSSFFAPEDYLDFRYFRKRAAYMAYIASALLDLSSNRTCSFDFLDGDGLRPIVIINSPNVKATVRIIPAISSDLFPMDKLSSSSCCAWRDIGASTAQYNASIIADAYHLENTERHRRLAASHPGFEGGLVLGSAWLSHRSYSSHLLDGGFGDNEWALLQSYIIGNNVDPKSSQHLSDPFQLFMSVLRLIEKTEPTASPIDEANFALCTLNETSYNILFKISQWTYLAVLAPHPRSHLQLRDTTD
ncbi:U3 small nucleolar RNA-associated protein [Drechslerella dactyloides]|uniref:U3 small nucleolar RNA-associated protein 22 n=1 Tax=Drechslerella dactyloides TaxID=74499 RepID=A0AAD6NFU1_DREDA|nr:U3 small nucleolar RNA-associated protein [Drechslerella dactyloides]